MKAGIIGTGLAALFFIGITVGRALSGFITMKLSDPQMIRMGQAIILAGILIMLLPVGFGSQAGLLMIGLGCAPIYPCIIHSTPDHFHPLFSIKEDCIPELLSA